VIEQVKKINSTIIILLLLLSPLAVMSADHESDAGSLSVTVDKAEAALGSIITLTLDYSLPEGASIGQDPQIKGLEDLSVVDRDLAPGRIDVKVLLDTPQELKTSGIELAYTDGEGKESSLQAPGISVRVLSNIAQNEKEPDIKPILDIVPTKKEWVRWLIWGMVLLAVLLAAAAVILALKRWSARGQYVQVTDPAHILAKRQLHDLVREQLFEKGYHKEFYFRFSEIIRRYIEATKGFPAVEYTTEEISRHLVHDPDRQMLALLRHADLVKFADASVCVHGNQEEIKAVFDYIENTSPSQDDADRSARESVS